jgi:GT2 family glycosyltransferase
VSVVIPVRDGAATLGKLLDSIARQTLARERYEVIVVDNASRDGTAAIARSRGATVVTESVPNRSRARNRGVAAAHAQLIAFTDGDCLAAPAWLERLLECASKAPLVAGGVVTSTGEQPNAIERFETLWRFGQESWVKHQGWAATANLLVDRTAFDAVGGLDPTWRHIGEDVDFCLRATAAGYALDWCDGAEVFHYAETAIGPFLRRSFRHGYSVNQAYHRFGRGYQAWRHPRAIVSARHAFERLGIDPRGFDRGERLRMAALARLSYAARFAGSAWAELARAR